jgi:hypothetical protein
MQYRAISVVSQLEMKEAANRGGLLLALIVVIWAAQ